MWLRLESSHHTDQVFFELQVLGLTLVLAHPERNIGLSDDPERLLDWAKKGDSLATEFKKFKWALWSPGQAVS